ncbi:MAG: hemerythrin domain-containing protein [Desulfobaccales bacterium]
MTEQVSDTVTRRDFILKSGVFLGAAAWLGPARALAGEKTELETAEVTPTEDLMQEHGVLRRLLLLYDDLGSRLKQGREVPLEVLREATGIIRRFVEDYHEKDEEEYLFTRFEKAGKLVELVKVLYQQHQAGRKLTAALQGLLSRDRWGKAPERQQAAVYLHAFSRMYRPHAAREDTVLYPAFRTVISPKEFLDLGEKFEAKEEKLFGKDGFEKVVAQVADLERRLGIYQLSQFTPVV